MRLCSVIIPTCNKAPYLDLTLASFERQQATEYQIVIVDDGSTDETPAVIERYAKRLNIKHRRQENRGRGSARNEAVKLADGEVLIFSDDDRIVEPGFVAAHASHFADAGGDRRLVMGWQRGILSTWRPDLPLPPSVLWRFLSRKQLDAVMDSPAPVNLITADDVRERFAQTVESFALSERWWDEDCMPAVRRFGDDLKGFHVPWILGTTGNMSVLRQHVLDVGLFDEGFRGWGLEDLDLCYRLHKAGIHSIISRTAINYHQAHPVHAAKRSQWLENLLYLLKKWDAIDIQLYGYLFTRADTVDVQKFNQLVEELTREEPGSASSAALRQAYRELVRIRVSTLSWAGGVRLVGVVHEW